MTVHVDDPRSLALGIQQFRKTVSMEEKPAQVPTTIVNVQQNNASHSDRPGSFEEMLDQIRAEQKAVRIQGREVGAGEEDRATDPEGLLTNAKEDEQ